ncbi:choice-of-anchor F family protein [Marinobacter sp. NFXS11]|uniref:choice-of-anchor F family protein n=1 Tax=Marinobacter sp. NFXS11 TaxID=2818432 RepID=UPI0032DE883D
MIATKKQFARKPLAMAVMCSIVGLSQAALSATVENVNTDNLSVSPIEGKTLVYTDTEGTATFGWFDPVNDSGEIGLGLAVYNETFNGTVGPDVYAFAGCIMAQPDLAVNCQAPGDSGKRFKLKTVETNGPIDLVFDVTPDEETKLYRVIGKFSNLTDITNSVDGGLKAFRFETGFGVGNDFTSSVADDGLAFGFLADDSGKLSIGPIGKYPGGLFGGSRVEGLPFFSTSVAAFTEGATVANEDVLETSGDIPTQYAGLSGGNWLALANVPTGWFIDHDGNPANDSILLAYDDPATDAEDWKTFRKDFQNVIVDTRDLDGDPLTAEIEINAQNYDPNGDFFATVTNEASELQIIDVSDVKPLVDTLDEGDPAGATDDAITLTQLDASALYVADFNGTGAGFKILVDGEAVEVAQFADWASNPPKVLNAGDDSLYATWIADEGEEGMYELADGTLVTLEEVNALIISAPADYERVAGYVQGPIEDLANVNINTTISVADASSWPTCSGDGNVTNCTFTLRVTGLNDAVDEPTIPVTPVVPEPEEPAAAPSSGGGTIFGCTAGKPGAPFDPVLPGLVLMALGGLWARKRLSNA